MDEKKISVRHLVEFLYRSGDIDRRRGETGKLSAMQAGSRIHRKIQKQMGSGYRSEVPLAITLQVAQSLLCIEGRADGIVEGDIPLIDEIKGVYLDLDKLTEPVPVHLAQALMYGYIYSTEHAFSEIDIQITYCHLKTEEINRLTKRFSRKELEDWFSDTIARFEKFLTFEAEHKEERNQTILDATFPYAYRAGQKEMIASVYKAISEEKTLYVQAPTGIGKTLGVLYPSLQAMARGMADKVFYLTAKTIARTVAIDTLDFLRERGMHVSSVALTAKEKICPQSECVCNPEACPFAKGHFDRINDALYDILVNEIAITRETILTYSTKHQVCPFEFSLDLSEWVDAIICDYNYVFDPRVNLKRYFADGNKGEYLFLVDEAHNLYERASAMYSAELCKEDFLFVRRKIKDGAPALSRALESCNREMLSLKKLCDEYLILSSVSGLMKPVTRAIAEYEDIFEHAHYLLDDTEVLELYFKLYHFANMYELCDEHYVIYCEQKYEDKFIVRLYCVDTSANLSACIGHGRSTVFFSATLLPVNYYKSLLSDVSDPAVYIPSPFPKENREILIGKDVSSRYTRRGREEYLKLFSYIESCTDAHPGNYMIFFPSYRMLKDVYAIACEYGYGEKHTCILQESDMDEQAREEFLQSFREGEKVTGWCTLGGIFAEGIDLTGERLVGTIVVGTGLPLVCNEREILMRYFEENKGEGYAYAYLYPGMNKVLQAAGRVIRTPEDRGVILLLDERFLKRESAELFPLEWDDLRVTDRTKIATDVKNFWDT